MTPNPDPDPDPLCGFISDYNASMMVEYPIIGVIFFYTFNAIVYFVLLNILLAILVEAYMKVVDDTQDAPSLVQEIKSISRSVFRDWQLGRDHHADSDHPESWMAEHYATQEEMMQAFGDCKQHLNPHHNSDFLSRRATRGSLHQQAQGRPCPALLRRVARCRHSFGVGLGLGSGLDLWPYTLFFVRPL